MQLLGRTGPDGRPRTPRLRWLNVTDAWAVVTVRGGRARRRGMPGDADAERASDPTLRSSPVGEAQRRGRLAWCRFGWVV